MKKWMILIGLLFLSGIAAANPVVVDPIGDLAFTAVVGSSVLIEACLVTLVLLFWGMSPKPVFFGLFFGNLAIYFILFLPLLEIVPAIWITEILIVAADSMLIRLLSAFELFQGEDFKRIRWYAVLPIAAAGNLVSYYVGVAMNP